MSVKVLFIYTTPSDAKVELFSDSGPNWVAVNATEPNSGRFGHKIEIDGHTNGWGASLRISKPDYVSVEQRGRLFVDVEGYAQFLVDDVVLLPFEFKPLPRLLVRGLFFEKETGERFTAIECSDFNLLARFSRGEDIKPILKQRKDLGFNMLRVWTLMHLSQFGIGDLDPCPYDQVPAFLKLCARYGLYVEFTAYTGVRDGNHWDRLSQAIVGAGTVLLELVNENDQTGNHIDPSLFKPVPGVLCSHGSNGSQAWPVEPYWDYATFHTNGASEEQRKVGHNAMEIWNGPTLTNETSRFPEVGMWSGANHARQEALAFDSAAGAALLCAGSCFHSVQGKSSVLFDGDHRAAALSWTGGVRSIDLTNQDGPYVHRQDLETIGILRAYQRANSIALIRS